MATLAELKQDKEDLQKQKRAKEKRLANVRERHPGPDEKRALKARLKSEVRLLEERVEDLRQRIEQRKESPDGHRVVPRSEWGAKAPRSAPTRMTSYHNGVFIHHSVAGAPTSENGEREEMRNLQDIAFSRDFADISYSFVVAPSGRIYEGRGRNVAGAHTLNFNSSSYGVCFMGNYETKKPTDKQIKAARWLRREYLKLGVRPVRGHRDVYSTACPGDNLYDRIKEL